MSPISREQAALKVRAYPNGGDTVVLVTLACPRCLRVNKSRALRPFPDFDGRSEWSLSWDCWCGELLTVTAKEIADRLHAAGKLGDAEWFRP